MSKKERHKQELIQFFEEMFRSGDTENLEQYLISNSSLPGRRANLELAAAFGDVAGDYTDEGWPMLWDLVTGLAAISADEAPVNDPKEFLPFCGAVGIGSVGAVSREVGVNSLATLRTLSNDPRWRMREAVCFGLQRLIAGRNLDTLNALEAWIPGGSFLEIRAAAAAVAEPNLLQDEETARSALQIHQSIIERVRESQARKGDDFRTLRKALGYTVSVVVQAVPEAGFAFLSQLASSQDSDLRWIAKQNLKKNRLLKRFPEQAEATLGLLE